MNKCEYYQADYKYILPELEVDFIQTEDDPNNQCDIKVENIIFESKRMVAKKVKQVNFSGDFIAQNETSEKKNKFYATLERYQADRQARLKTSSSLEIKKKKMIFTSKYMADKQEVNQLPNTGNIYPWLKKPSLKSMDLSQITFQKNLKSLSHKFEQLDSNFNLLFVSESTLSNDKACQRHTFIMAGRGKEGYAPVDNGLKGRVCLVIDESQFKDLKPLLKKKFDLLILQAKNDSWQDNIKTIHQKRLAVLKFAVFQKINDMIMLDDNILNYYLANKLEAQWEEIYHLFKQASLQSGSALISARAFDPRYNQEFPRKQEKDFNAITVHFDQIGCKVLYLNMEKITKKISHLAYLLPEDILVCGEDIFMHLALEEKGLKTSVMDRSFFFYTKSKRKSNLAASQTKKAEDWLKQEASLSAPDWHKRAYLRMVELIKESQKFYLQKSIHQEEAEFALKRKKAGAKQIIIKDKTQTIKETQSCSSDTNEEEYRPTKRYKISKGSPLLESISDKISPEQEVVSSTNIEMSELLKFLNLKYKLKKREKGGSTETILPKMAVSMRAIDEKLTNSSTSEVFGVWTDLIMDLQRYTIKDQTN